MRVLKCCESGELRPVCTQLSIKQQWIKCCAGVCGCLRDLGIGRDDRKRIRWEFTHSGIPPQTSLRTNSGSVQPWTPSLGLC